MDQNAFIFPLVKFLFWVVNTVEQQLLEREIGNLQFRRHQQQQPQQNQKQVQAIQQNRYNKYQPPVTQEPDSQFAALAI